VLWPGLGSGFAAFGKTEFSVPRPLAGAFVAIRCCVAGGGVFTKGGGVTPDGGGVFTTGGGVTTIGGGVLTNGGGVFTVGGRAAPPGGEELAWANELVKNTVRMKNAISFIKKSFIPMSA
jgi:hypothetical protein